MALSTIITHWGQQLTAGEDTTFTIETNALASTNSICEPIFRFHNFGDEACTLEIVYYLELTSATADPLMTGTYTNTVVDTTVAAESMYTFDFGGIPLNSDEVIATKHVVTITNTGASTHVFHSVLWGKSEVQTQYPSANSIIRNT